MINKASLLMLSIAVSIFLPLASQAQSIQHFNTKNISAASVKKIPPHFSLEGNGEAQGFAIDIMNVSFVMV